MPIEIKEIVIRAEIDQSRLNSEQQGAEGWASDSPDQLSNNSIEMIRELIQQELERHERKKETNNRISSFTR